MRYYFLVVLAVLRLQGAEPSRTNASSHSFVIGLTPFLQQNTKDEVYRGIVRLLVQDLPLNSTVSIYDAFGLKTVTEVHIPAAAVFSSPKTRANQFASSIGQLKRFLAANHEQPVGDHLQFNSAIRLPQFCDFLLENLHETDSALSILLIGSPLYQDEKETGFSMIDGYFPSDGHLQATREESVFGVKNSVQPASTFMVHWACFGDPWLSDLYREKVTRFWSLYLQGRGGRLVTFCGDFPTALQSFQAGADSSGASQLWAIDPQQTKIEMLRVQREVELTDWIRRDSVAEQSGPPGLLVGPMKIGIRWKDNIDLDLYASANSGAETLFFQHPHSPEGYYYKDHRSSPGREYEFVEFEKPVDVRRVEAFVNFYKGHTRHGTRGEVRIEFDSRIYSAPFSIEASEGNRGRSGPDQETYWHRIPVQEILQLQRLARVH